MIDWSKVKRVHLIGVAGTGMGSFAGMLKAAGYEVTGSDENVYPPMSTQLERWGIEVDERLPRRRTWTGPGPTWWWWATSYAR